MRSDRRSEAAQLYRRWYKSKAWEITRRDQLLAEPWCRMCLEAKQRTFATHVDHITPHRGDRHSFFNGPFQSLCALHHSASKQREEVRGYSTQADDDGYPTDPRHPANRA
jgi:5-methylcytosine-specific restriction enzyme A